MMNNEPNLTQSLLLTTIVFIVGVAVSTLVFYIIPKKAGFVFVKTKDKHRLFVSNVLIIFMVLLFLLTVLFIWKGANL